MLSRTLSVCFLVMLIALPLAASAGPEQDARTAIRASYVGMDKALAHHDLSAYLAYLHPEYAGADPTDSETHGKNAVASPLRQMFAMAKTDTYLSTMQSFSLQDGGALVTARENYFVSGTNEGKPVVIRSVYTVRDFWVKTGGRWLLRRERRLSGNVSVNGHETIFGGSQAGGSGEAASTSPAGSDSARLTEPSGGFSYVVPDGWHIRTFPGLKYKISYAAPAQGFAPNINVADESAAVPMDDYVQLSITQMKRLFSDFQLLSQTEFVTSSGLRGVRLATADTVNGGKLRQAVYLFPGAGDRKIAVTASWLASDGDKYADAVDASLKTFALEPAAATP